MASSTLTPLSFAYLAELSFVLNLTYKELKYDRTTEALKRSVAAAHEKIDQLEFAAIAKDSDEYRNLQGLLDCSQLEFARPMPAHCSRQHAALGRYTLQRVPES